MEQTSWPLFIISAAVCFATPHGIDTRSVHGFRLAASPEEAQHWFLMTVLQQVPNVHVLDVQVSEMPRDVLQIALGIGDCQQEYVN